mmetsp:Transcript_65683/g.106484  ORF Transcript_65683/g.106484 Transcript_65683/m.106484 type:complete len:490 (-) Transcript_65683:227-1696(-)
MCETGVEALQAKLKLADQETEDAKEALRIERAKMTREKKQWALQSKSEEKRWADDMAQLSREKRMWAEEKDRLTSPRVLQSEKSRWDQERRSLAEQHRQEIEELMARVSTASENPPTSAELAHAPSSATEADRAQWEQDCQQMGNEITDLRSTLENLEQTLKNSEQTKEEIGKRLHTADMWKNEAQTKSDDLEQLLQLERSGAEAGKEQIKQLKGLQSKSEEIVSKAHREALGKSQTQTLASQAHCNKIQLELDSTRAQLAEEKRGHSEQRSAAETLRSIMEEEVGETKAEREKWQQKRAILERAHIKDMIELQEQQAELREDDMINFRAVLKEEHDKLKMVEDAWKGLLAGTHDAQLSYNTQRLSTGTTLLHVTCATVRQVGAGASAIVSKPRQAESVSVHDRLRMTGALGLPSATHRESENMDSSFSPSYLPISSHHSFRPRPKSSGPPSEELSGGGRMSASQSLSHSLAEKWGSKEFGCGSFSSSR